MLLVPAKGKSINTLTDLLESGLKWGVKDRDGWRKWAGKFKNNK